MRSRPLPRVGDHHQASHDPERSGRGGLARRQHAGQLWVRTANGWRKDGWTTRFDHSPTYTQGAPGLHRNRSCSSSTLPTRWPPTPTRCGSTASRRQQVASLAQVTAGDVLPRRGRRSQLHFGSNPTGHNGRGEHHRQGALGARRGVIIRGIGVRRYAPSMCMVAGDHARVSRRLSSRTSCRWTWRRPGSVRSATDILDRPRHDPGQRDARPPRPLRRPSASDIGDCATGNNVERFNVAPNAGGRQDQRDPPGDRSRQQLLGNQPTASGSTCRSTTRATPTTRSATTSATGLFLEISAAPPSSTTFSPATASSGSRSTTPPTCKIWNNTFVGNGRPLNIVQDPPEHEPERSSVDPRVPWPDPADAVDSSDLSPIANNVVGSARSSANCLLCVEDYSQQKYRRADGHHRQQQRLPPGVHQPAELARGVVRGDQNPEYLHDARRLPIRDRPKTLGQRVHRRTDRRRQRRPHIGRVVAGVAGGFATAVRCGCRRTPRWRGTPPRPLALTTDRATERRRPPSSLIASVAQPSRLQARTVTAHRWSIRTPNAHQESQGVRARGHRGCRSRS